MTEIMTASDEAMLMTDEQIENVLNKLRGAMLRHRSEIPSNIAQHVLGADNLGMVLFAPFCERAAAICKMIVRRVKIDRTCTLKEMLKATDRDQNVNDDVIATMALGKGNEKNVYFFMPEPWEYTHPGYMSDEDLEKAMKRRVLVSDPYAQIQVNIDDPAFAEEHPNGTHFKDADGNLYSLAFDRWLGRRRVSVCRVAGGWGYDWWFGGVLASEPFGIIS